MEFLMYWHKPSDINSFTIIEKSIIKSKSYGKINTTTAQAIWLHRLQDLFLGRIITSPRKRFLRVQKFCCTPRKQTQVDTLENHCLLSQYQRRHHSHWS